jgi:hypothetical protein
MEISPSFLDHISGAEILILLQNVSLVPSGTNSFFHKFSQCQRQLAFFAHGIEMGPIYLDVWNYIFS